MDQYSRWRRLVLVQAVGTVGTALIDAAFPGQEATAQKRAGDGAAVDGTRARHAQLAIRKVQVNLEVQVMVLEITWMVLKQRGATL